MSSSFLTIKELSQWLNIKPSTLYAWVAQGKIPFYKIHGLIRFRLKAIVRWLKSFSCGNANPLPRKLGAPDHGDLEGLIARAKREVYNSPHGETRPKSSLT
jgi:excisionase family DNA binding protein